jgi:hypothetical protein
VSHNTEWYQLAIGDVISEVKQEAAMRLLNEFGISMEAVPPDDMMIHAIRNADRPNDSYRIFIRRSAVDRAGDRATISFINYEFVDGVKTLTLAEGPAEAGLILHLMRATWEDDDDFHHVANAVGTNVVRAISAWRLAEARLVLVFKTQAAEHLGVGRRLELDIAPGSVSLQPDALHEWLTDILIDVPEGMSG